MDSAWCTHTLNASIVMEHQASSQRQALPLKPSEACLRLPPRLPGGDMAVLALIGVYRQYPGASAHICRLQVDPAHQSLMSLKTCSNCMMRTIKEKG